MDYRFLAPQKEKQKMTTSISQCNLLIIYKLNSITSNAMYLIIKRI